MQHSFRDDAKRESGEALSTPEKEWLFDLITRLMEGATEVKCSEFGDNIIAHM